MHMEGLLLSTGVKLSLISMQLSGDLTEQCVVSQLKMFQNIRTLWLA